MSRKTIRLSASAEIEIKKEVGKHPTENKAINTMLEYFGLYKNKSEILYEENILSY